MLLWERALEPFAGRWSLPGGELARRRDARAVDPPAPGGEGRRPRALPSRAARDPERPGPEPPALGDRDRLPRARPARTSTRRSRPIPAGTPSPRISTTPSTTSSSRLSAWARLRGEALLHEHRLRARAGDVHDLGAPRPLPRGARPRRLGDEPAARPAPPPPARADRRAAGSRARPGGRPAALFRFRLRELQITDQFAVLRPRRG